MDATLTWLLDNPGSVALGILGVVGLLILVGGPLVLGLGSIGRTTRDMHGPLEDWWEDW